LLIGKERKGNLNIVSCDLFFLKLPNKLAPEFKDTWPKSMEFFLADMILKNLFSGCK